MTTELCNRCGLEKKQTHICRMLCHFCWKPITYKANIDTPFDEEGKEPHGKKYGNCYKEEAEDTPWTDYCWVE
jgi:hypothetical protein